MEIQLDEKLDEKYYKRLDDEFSNYAIKNGLECKYKRFTFTARENGEVLGMITGHSYYNEVHISDLLVFEENRGKHIGTKLVKYVEDYYGKRGFSEFTLNTYEFQAPLFYKKCGYEIEYVRENKDNPKLSKYYFIKHI